MRSLRPMNRPSVESGCVTRIAQWAGTERGLRSRESLCGLVVRGATTTTATAGSRSGLD
jgi:hypothetical protein